MLLDSIQLCVFDMAGTTVDEKNLVYKTLQQAIQPVIASHGLKVSLETVLEHGAGKEKHQAIVDTLRAITLDIGIVDIHTLANKAFQAFQPMLTQAYRDHSMRPVDGVEDLFTELRERGVFVVLNTGYSRVTAESIFKRLDWTTGETVDALITADDVSSGRPAPDMINLAMRQFGINHPECVLKAGDSAIDIEEGKNANCGVTVGVLTGAQTREQIAQAEPDIIVDNLSDILSL